MQRQVMSHCRRFRQPFSEGIEPMTDDEQILEAIAQAFGTLSERLSKELEDAFNQMA
jgi:hypothetical protein